MMRTARALGLTLISALSACASRQALQEKLAGHNPKTNLASTPVNVNLNATVGSWR